MLTLLWVCLHFLSILFHTLKCCGSVPRVTLLLINWGICVSLKFKMLILLVSIMAMSQTLLTFPEKARSSFQLIKFHVHWLQPLVTFLNHYGPQITGKTGHSTSLQDLSPDLNSSCPSLPSDPRSVLLHTLQTLPVYERYM